MNTFYVIEKGNLYLGVSCGQFRYHSLENALKFHDVVSATEISNILERMFSSISDEFRNVKTAKYITEYDEDGKLSTWIKSPDKKLKEK